MAVARAIFEACRSYIVGDRKDIGYDDLYGNEQSDLLDAADAVLHAIPNSEANDDWHTDEDKAWEAEMNDADRGLVDAFGVKPDFVVGSPDAIPNSAASDRTCAPHTTSYHGTRPEDWHATRNSAAKLTGDCETDCVDGCAYPGQFSECELGDAT